MGLVSELRQLGVDVLRRGLMLTLTGTALGLVGAWFVSRWTQSLLFDTSGADIPTYLLCAVTLVIVAVLACTLPARRATRVNPIEALRAE